MMEENAVLAAWAARASGRCQATALRVAGEEGKAMGQKLPSGVKPVCTVDLSHTRCPLTYARVRTVLDVVESGEIVEFLLIEGEHLEQVPPVLKEEGHRIINVRRDGDQYRLLVQKNGGRVADKACGCCPGGVCGPASGGRAKAGGAGTRRKAGPKRGRKGE